MASSNVMTSPRPGRTAAALLLCCALLLSHRPPAAAQTDLAPLFAPPTPEELADVAADWAARITAPSALEVYDTGDADGFRVDGVRFVLAGVEQYGAIRYPRGFRPGGRYPVLVALHGGFHGLDLNWLLTFDAAFPSGCVADSFVVVAPSFRGEVVNGYGVIANRLGVGEARPFARDGDDAIAMLNAALALVPEADPGRVSAFSRSRGGPAAVQLLLRDPRVRRAACLFGPADFLLPHVQAGAREFLDAGATADRLGELVGRNVAAPWLAGELTLAQARHLLLSWCTPPHVTAPLAVQLHHGDRDGVVPVEHSRSLAAALTAAGAAAPDFACFEYPGGSHNAAALAGHEPRLESHLCGPAHAGRHAR